ncbi:MAG: transketolase family protein [Patescibacteria group bacterium]|jgi:transketolase
MLKTAPLTSNREGFGVGVVEAGKNDPNVVVLTADLSESTCVEDFQKAFPDRFIQVGVAEQNLAGIAAGMALAGKVPFMTSYGVFSPGRNWDQIRISICYSKANVKIIGSHGGLATGRDGATHQALEDIALTRVLPNMTVIVPCDYDEARKATLAAARVHGPVYIRLCREKTPTLTSPTDDFEIGKAQILKQGEKVTLVGCGPILANALEAAIELEEQGISCEVINCSTIKPLDEKTLLASARKTGKVITIEDHQIIGGLGSAVAELLSETFPVKMKRLGMRDKFGESGTYEELLHKYEMDPSAIKKAIIEILL